MGIGYFITKLAFWKAEMPGLQIPRKEEIMLSSASHVDEIISPLKEVQISFFSYVRIDADGARIDLNNSAPASDYVYYQTDAYLGYSAESEPVQFNDEFSLGNELNNDPTIALLRNDFNIDNMFIMVDKFDDYTEIWSFGSPRGLYEINDFYLANTAWLKKFRFYFKDKARHLIKQFNQHRLPTPLLDGQVPPVQNLQAKPIDLDIDRYYFHKESYLTTKEYNCLYWIARGKSSKEIAKILSISYRTVESYTEALKIKFECKKLPQLIFKATKFDIPL